MREYNINELKEIIREAYLDLLTEDAESSNRKKARQLLRDKEYVTRDNFKAGDEEGNLLSNEWLDYIFYDNDVDLFKVINNNKQNYIDKQGNLLFKEWYDNIWYYKMINLFKVKNNNEEYYIDVNENIIED